jgi:hypothetical protein
MVCGCGDFCVRDYEQVQLCLSFGLPPLDRCVSVRGAVVSSITCWRSFVDVKGVLMAEIGEPIREIEIVPREEPLPEELPAVEPLTPDPELEPV